jgi:hypothetical protein
VSLLLTAPSYQHRPLVVAGTIPTLFLCKLTGMSLHSERVERRDPPPDDGGARDCHLKTFLRRTATESEASLLAGRGKIARGRQRLLKSARRSSDVRQQRRRLRSRGKPALRHKLRTASTRSSAPPSAAAEARRRPQPESSDWLAAQCVLRPASLLSVLDFCFGKTLDSGTHGRRRTISLRGFLF